MAALDAHVKACERMTYATRHFTVGKKGAWRNGQKNPEKLDRIVSNHRCYSFVNSDQSPRTTVPPCHRVTMPELAFYMILIKCIERHIESCVTSYRTCYCIWIYDSYFLNLSTVESIM